MNHFDKIISLEKEIILVREFLNGRQHTSGFFFLYRKVTTALEFAIYCIDTEIQLSDFQFFSSQYLCSWRKREL